MSLFYLLREVFAFDADWYWYDDKIVVIRKLGAGEKGIRSFYYYISIAFLYVQYRWRPSMWIRWMTMTIIMWRDMTWRDVTWRDVIYWLLLLSIEAVPYLRSKRIAFFLSSYFCFYFCFCFYQQHMILCVTSIFWSFLFQRKKNDAFLFLVELKLKLDYNWWTENIIDHIDCANIVN